MKSNREPKQKRTALFAYGSLVASAALILATWQGTALAQPNSNAAGAAQCNTQEFEDPKREQCHDAIREQSGNECLAMIFPGNGDTTAFLPCSDRYASAKN